MILKHLNGKTIPLTIYLFIVIFQPGFLPINTIYLVGAVTVVFLIIDSENFLSIKIINSNSVEMIRIFRGFILLSLYIIIISALNIITGGITVLDNRIRCINQLVVLTGIEFICIYFFLEKCKKHKLNMDDVISIIAMVGILQGACSISAYLFPSIRQFFLRYNGNLFLNAYVLERRGYGFSNVLVDTYGYGVGLIAGSVLLYKNATIFDKIIVTFFCSVSIVLNARTGLVVLALAISINLFQANNLPKFILKSLFAVFILFMVYRYGLPILIEKLSSSDSINSKWIGGGLEEFQQLISGNSSVDDVNFLSSFDTLPDNIFDWILGTGHNVYGLRSVIGFHSDVGYINYIWEFGIMGMCYLFILIAGMYRKTYLVCDGNNRFVVIFLTVSYVTVLFKGILIGYNPGVVVNYLVCFSFVFFSKIKNDVEGESNE